MSTSDNLNNSSLRLKLQRECHAMAEYALGTGKKLPEFVVEVLTTVDDSVAPPGDQTEDPASRTADCKRLAQAHYALARIVEPAVPRSVLFLQEEAARAGRLQCLSSVPLVRRLMVTASVLLVAVVGLGTSEYIDASTDSLLETQGLHGLVKSLFYVSSAGLGAVFAAIYQLNRYIGDRTYDPEYESTYWARFGLGIISGFFLSQMLPMTEAMAAGGFGKPILAFLGGFSVSAVWRVLQRMVDAMESIFQGTQVDTTSIRQAADARAGRDIAEERLQLTSSLMELRRQVATDEGSEKLVNRVDQILGDLMPDDPASGHD